MAGKYDKMTTEDFDRLLEDVVNDNNHAAFSLAQIPGVYEIIAEHYNNEVLDAWQAEQDANKDDENES